VLERVDRLHGAYENGQAGRTASLTYIPGKGTIYGIDDRVIATIPGSDFAAAYFTVWLGARPSSRSVKRGLLAESK
jgi:hypothetical protein